MDKTTRTARNRIPTDLRFQLRATIDLGLSHFGAGRICGVPSVSRIIREEAQKLPGDEKEERRKLKRARLDAVIAVSQALDKGLVNRRNVRKLNEKVEFRVAKYLKQMLPNLHLPLP